MSRSFWLALVGASLICTTLNAAELSPTPITVLSGHNALKIPDALVSADELMVPVDFVKAVSGFELKREGLCAGDVCIPVAPDSGWVVDRDGKKYFNVTRFSKKLDQVYTVDEAGQVWSFTPVPQSPAAPLATGMAPDFALPDLSGKMVRLSDFRGKKVLILTWASWCGCKMDLSGWQKEYNKLKDQNFEIVAAAQDTEGQAVAEPWYTKGKVSYTALVDTKHVVTSLYQMVNVPAGVWVDEQGKIVRPAEVAYSHKQQIFGQTIGDDRYAAGLADWVKKGPESAFVVAEDQLKQKLATPAAKMRLADAEFQLGAYFSLIGKPELATVHWQKAQQLSPDNWNYHRQDWSFDKKKAMNNWLAKFRALNGRPYYDPVEFPAE